MGNKTKETLQLNCIYGKENIEKNDQQEVYKLTEAAASWETVESNAASTTAS